MQKVKGYYYVSLRRGKRGQNIAFIRYVTVEWSLISETKINYSFPTAQFQIKCYTTYRLDKNANDGDTLFYIREGIPCTLLNSNMSVESFYIEIKEMAVSLQVQSKYKLNFKPSLRDQLKLV